MALIQKLQWVFPLPCRLSLLQNNNNRKTQQNYSTGEVSFALQRISNAEQRINSSSNNNCSKLKTTHYFIILHTFNGIKTAWSVLSVHARSRVRISLQHNMPDLKSYFIHQSFFFSFSFCAFIRFSLHYE